ncbi:MAG: hypothetical protein ABIK12_00320 [Pseudomonadota bacterium]
MRDRRAHHNLFVVSANNQEPGLNQEQVLDTLFLVEKGNIADFGRRAEKDVVLAGGPAEPEKAYYFGNTVEFPFNSPKLQPQHAAFLAAYGLGSCESAAAGASGYLHTITPVDGVDALRDLPTFTAAQRLGQTIESRLYVSMLVDSFTLSFAKDDWLKAQATFKASGKTQSNMLTEEITGNSDDDTVTLAENAVAGSTAQARLDAVHKVFFKRDDQDYWSEAQVLAASGATPAVLSIVPPDATGTHAGVFKVIYAPDPSTSLETGSATADPAYDLDNNQSTLTDGAATLTPDAHVGRWLVMTSGTASGAMFLISGNTATVITLDGYDLYSRGVRSADTYKIVNRAWLPLSQSKVDQPPLRCNQVQVILGGHFDGSAISGGWRLGNECNSLEWALQNASEIPFLAGDKDYASAADRGERTQTLKVDRRMMDAIYRALLEAGSGDNQDEPDYFAVQMVAEGPEYEDGYTYLVRVTWPRVALMAAKPGLDGQKLSEELELAVLSDPDYGSVVVEVRDKVATYAAA